MGEVLGLVGVGEFGEGLGHSMEAEGVKLIEGGMFEQVRSPNCSSGARGCWHGGSERSVRGAPGRRPPVELVVEDGFDGAVGPGADLDGALGGGFRRAAPWGPASRTMPRQARKPCSGCGRDSRISSHSAAVAGPILRASSRMRSIVQPA